MDKMHQVMQTTWLVNAIVNGLHEPKCLIKEFLALEPALAQQISSLSLDQDEKDFLCREIDQNVAWFEETIALLQQTNQKLQEAKQNL